jgi:hypothetical protein
VLLLPEQSHLVFELLPLLPDRLQIGLWARHD